MTEPLASLLRVDPLRLRRLLEEELAGHAGLRDCGRAVIQELAGEMVARLPEALATDLEALVVEAFRRWPTEPAGAGAGEEDLPLPSQRLHSSHHPALVLWADERPLLEVRFDLSLELRLEGVVLRLREGVARAVTIRRTLGSGILLHDRQMLSQFADAPLTLPPRLSLEAPRP